jgi:hypothetical protein
MQFLIFLLLSTLYLQPVSSTSLSNNFSSLQWDWTPEQITGSDPNHHDRFLCLKLPFSSTKPPSHILASRTHLLLAFREQGKSFWLQSKMNVWSIWIYSKKNLHWIHSNEIIDQKVIKWVYAFSLEDALVFDLLIEDPQSLLRSVRRYWIRTNEVNWNWQELIKGSFLDASVRSNTSGAAYRYLYALEPGLLYKIDLIRLKTFSRKIPLDCHSLHLEYLNPQVSENEGAIVVHSSTHTLKFSSYDLSLID